MGNATEELKREIEQLERDLASRKQALKLISVPSLKTPLPLKKKGVMLAKGRAAVAKAQRARWAKIRAAKKKSPPSK